MKRILSKLLLFLLLGLLGLTGSATVLLATPAASPAARPQFIEFYSPL